MLGFAQKLFLERSKASFATPSLDSFSFIDQKVAHLLLKNPSEEELAFLCFLSAAVRRGHLCVRVGEKILPEPATVDMEQVPEELLSRGAAKLPEQLFAGPLRKEGDCIYFQRYWQAEKRCLQLFQQLLANVPSLSIDQAFVAKELQALGGKLQPEQAQAIRHASQNALTLICGGPGTGKTYTIGHLVRIFQQAAPQLLIALAAPTGKAAVHLEKSLGNGLRATTLHALLGTSTLSADLIVVDESSMIDLKLMTALLAAVKPGARLILVGDRHQLAPVESGSLFADLVALGNPVELKISLRTDVSSLITLAEAIQMGNADQVLQLLKSGALQNISYHPIVKEETLQRQLVDPVYRDRASSFRLLSPLRKGPLGVDALNRACAARHEFSFKAPIILTRSDRRLGLFNGEMGLLMRDSQGREEALFQSSGDELRRLPAFLLPTYEYAYCLSVYKSQGSEFDEVWLLLPQGSEHFGRELLYTAVTRARKRVQIWGTEETIRKTVERRVQRLSGITVLLGVVA